MPRAAAVLAPDREGGAKSSQRLNFSAFPDGAATHAEALPDAVTGKTFGNSRSARGAAGEAGIAVACRQCR